jgi:hypothetical protein
MAIFVYALRHPDADDPIVKEIMAKLSGNGGKSTTPVKGKEVK